MTDPIPHGGRRSELAALRRFVGRPPAAARCELCAAPLAPEHRHLLEMAGRQVRCACDPCALRFRTEPGGPLRLIPRDAYALPDFRMTESAWDQLALPIGLAFFFRDTAEDRILALYPSPAGATASEPPPRAWDDLVADNAFLAQLAPDVEALLVNRVATTRQYFVAPIDTCYELVGLVRLHWRGLTGGEDVWREVERFFAELDRRSRPITTASLGSAHA